MTNRRIVHNAALADVPLHDRRHGTPATIADHKHDRPLHNHGTGLTAGEISLELVWLHHDGLIRFDDAGRITPTARARHGERGAA